MSSIPAEVRPPSAVYASDSKQGMANRADGPNEGGSRGQRGPDDVDMANVNPCKKSRRSSLNKNYFLHNSPGEEPWARIFPDCTSRKLEFCVH